MENGMHTYRAYGLNFGSVFPLPELGAEVAVKPDIMIRYGEVPETLESPSAHGIAWQASPGKNLLTVSDVARYLVVKDNEIVVEPMSGSTEREVRIFLLGSVLGALLHARKMLVLHSSVVQTERGAVLFMGKSGAGKSTIASEFLKRGYSILSDDKAGIILDDQGVAQVMPGFPTIRLTKETVTELGLEVDKAKRSPGLGKFVLPVKQFCSDTIPVHAAYGINVHNKSEISLERLDPMEQFEVLNANIYRRKFAHDSARKSAHFRILGAVSGQATVTKVMRPINPGMIKVLVDRFEEDLEI